MDEGTSSAHSPLTNSYLVNKLLHLEVFLVQCANHEEAGIGFIIYLAVYLVLMYVKMYGKMCINSGRKCKDESLRYYLQ